LFGKKIKLEFKNSSSEALQEMKMYEKHSKRQTLFLSSAVVILITGVVISPMILPASIAILTIRVAVETIGVINAKRKEKNLHKAIWLFNRDKVI